MMEIFSDRMRLAAKEAGIKPAQMASALKKNRSTVQQWFDGTVKSISGDSLTAVAKLLNVRVEWLAAGEGPMRLMTDQTQADSQHGLTTLHVPDALIPMFEAWLALHLKHTIPPDILEANTLLAQGLTTALQHVKKRPD